MAFFIKYFIFYDEKIRTCIEKGLLVEISLIISLYIEFNLGSAIGAPVLESLIANSPICLKGGENPFVGIKWD